MRLSENKPLIALGVIMALLLVVLLVVKGMGSVSNTSSDDNSNKKKTANIDYPEINDSAEDVLDKIYNSNHDYYTGFDNDSSEKENIFGNKQEKSVASLSQKTRMTLALNTFELDDMKKMNCNNIGWNNSWLRSVCGSNLGNVAYTLSVQELNNRVEDMFNIRPDYSTLNIDDLTIGTCSGGYSDNYIFRYIKEQSIYVSTKRTSSCVNHGKIDIKSVSKTQAKDLLTLTIDYTKTPTRYSGGRTIYTTPINQQDKFFFKVTGDGKYYLDRTTMTKGE